MTLGVGDNRRHVHRSQRGQERLRIDEHLMRQLQQEISALVGYGQKVIGIEQRGDSLIQPHVRPGQDGEGNPYLQQTAVQFLNRVADRVCITTAFEPAQLVRRSDCPLDPIGHQRPAQSEHLDPPGRAVIKPGKTVAMDIREARPVRSGVPLHSTFMVS